MVELHRRSACNTTYDRKETDVKKKNPTYIPNTSYINQFLVMYTGILSVVFILSA